MKILLGVATAVGALVVIAVEMVLATRGSDAGVSGGHAGLALLSLVGLAVVTLLVWEAG